MEVKKHRFPYEWEISDTKFTKNKGTVFSCFACGGGSSFGYKLAGFDVIGCNEIDPKMMDIYKINHNPKMYFLEGIQDFKNRPNLPSELFNLDILDGSPPCSSFSMAGNREKDWGKEKKFREGQSKQVLDTLFFDFIDLAKRLQPKVVIAENVKGILLGNAKKYVIEIYKQFDKAGYYCQHFLLDASKMGVPQRRERVFFICLRKDLAKPFLYQKSLFDIVPKLELNFDEKPILFGEIQNNLPRKKLSPTYVKCFEQADKNGYYTTPKGSGYGFFYKAMKNLVCNTLTTSGQQISIEERPEQINKNEIIKISTFPKDYDFLGNKVGYVCGMSVPPVVMANISEQIYLQWLCNLK